jgi:hypothetical protein
MAERPNRGEIRLPDRPLPDKRKPMQIPSRPALIPLLRTVSVAAASGPSAAPRPRTRLLRQPLQPLRGSRSSSPPAARHNSRFPPLIPRGCACRGQEPCMRECEALYCEANVHTLKTLKPGQAGTKSLLARYVTGVPCVCYRYHEATREASQDGRADRPIMCVVSHRTSGCDFDSQLRGAQWTQESR